MRIEIVGALLLYCNNIRETIQNNSTVGNLSLLKNKLDNSNIESTGFKRTEVSYNGGTLLMYVEDIVKVLRSQVRLLPVSDLFVALRKENDCHNNKRVKSLPINDKIGRLDCLAA